MRLFVGEIVDEGRFEERFCGGVVLNIRVVIE